MSIISSDFAPPNSRVLTSVGDRMRARLTAHLRSASRFERLLSDDTTAVGFIAYNGEDKLIAGTTFYLHFNSDVSAPELWIVIKGRSILLLVDDVLSDLDGNDLEAAGKIRKDLVELCPAA